MEQTCESCRTETEGLDFCTDPFLEEIHGDSTQFWICEKCWQESASDI